MIWTATKIAYNVCPNKATHRIWNNSILWILWLINSGGRTDKVIPIYHPLVEWGIIISQVLAHGNGHYNTFSFTWLFYGEGLVWGKIQHVYMQTKFSLRGKSSIYSFPPMEKLDIPDFLGEILVYSQLSGGILVWGEN